MKNCANLDADYLTIKATYAPDITCESNKKQKKLQKLREDKGFDCPDFFTLEKRLQKYNISNLPLMQNLIDIMIMLCINYYKQSRANWYNSNYSWYYTNTVIPAMPKIKTMNHDHSFYGKNPVRAQ